MLDSYKTVKEYAAAEIIIRKSRFIGHASPVATEEEAIRFVESIKKTHNQATHNCYAYLCGDRDEIQKHSDDGEPSGTAGKPIMEVMKHQELKNAVVVVTRYFGGILLGAGGLVRAYTESAAAGIEAAQPIVLTLHREIMVEVDYTWIGKIENELRQRHVQTGSPSFTDKVMMSCLPKEAETADFIEWMTNLTHGQALIKAGEVRYIG